jgi:subtilisin-like proprotein convertase family protein
MRARTLMLSLVATLVPGGFDRPAGADMGEVSWTYGGSFDLRIPADPDASKGWMNDAVVEVTEHIIIGDLDVTVSLSHSSVFDLRLSLAGPSGTKVTLNEFDPLTQYVEGADYDETIFDDEAAIGIEQGSAPFSGRYRPLGSLAAFDGEDACGLWTLEVLDSCYADTGWLEAYSLTILAPEPCTAVLVLLGSAMLGHRRRRHRAGR